MTRYFCDRCGGQVESQGELRQFAGLVTFAGDTQRVAGIEVCARCVTPVRAALKDALAAIPPSRCGASLEGPPELYCERPGGHEGAHEARGLRWN